MTYIKGRVLGKNLCLLTLMECFVQDTLQECFSQNDTFPI